MSFKFEYLKYYQCTLKERNYNFAQHVISTHIFAKLLKNFLFMRVNYKHNYAGANQFLHQNNQDNVRR